MAAVGRGFGATLGFGIESTWGTAVARSNWLRVRSCGLMRKVTRQAVPELGYAGQVSTAHRSNFTESDFAGGPIAWNLAYDDSSVLLMQHLLGANATSGASAPYTHLTTLASPLPIGLTIEQINGTHPAFNSAEVFEGCKLASGRISWESGSLVSVEAEVIAQTSGGLVAAGTPTYSSGGELIRHHQQAQATIGGASIPLRSISIAVDRGLERLHQLGTKFTSEPVEDRVEVMLDLVAAWQQATFDTNYLAGTQGDFEAAFTGTGDNSLTITAHNCSIWDLQRPITRAGWVEQRVQLKAFADSSDQGLAFSFTNANANNTDN